MSSYLEIYHDEITHARRAKVKEPTVEDDFGIKSFKFPCAPCPMSAHCLSETAIAPSQRNVELLS